MILSLLLLPYETESFKFQIMQRKPVLNSSRRTQNVWGYSQNARAPFKPTVYTYYVPPIIRAGPGTTSANHVINHLLASYDQWRGRIAESEFLPRYQSIW